MTRHLSHGLGLAVLASAALVSAGCGGSSSSPGVAQLSSSAASGRNVSGSSSQSEAGAPTQQQMVAFAKCMRTHGVPEFPEPSEGKLVIRANDANGHVSGLNPRSTQVQAARKACQKLLPNGGIPTPAQQAELQEGALKFSECMRTHGVPNFPDPTFSPNTVQLKGVGGPGGIDLGSPQVQAAQRRCRSVVPTVPGAKGGLAEAGAIAVGGPKG